MLYSLPWIAIPLSLKLKMCWLVSWAMPRDFSRCSIRITDAGRLKNKKRRGRFKPMLSFERHSSYGEHEPPMSRGPDDPKIRLKPFFRLLCPCVVEALAFRPGKWAFKPTVMGSKNKRRFSAGKKRIYLTEKCSSRLCPSKREFCSRCFSF